MMILQPYLGKKYKSKKAVLEDFNAGKDFIINDMTSRWDGKPISKSSLHGQTVQFRYDNDRKTFTHKVD